MPITHDQRKRAVAILLPHIDSEDDRRALILEAFHDEPIVTQLDYSGKVVTFAQNCLSKLVTYDDVPAVTRLLETLRKRVGPNRQREIDALLADLNDDPNIEPTPPPDTDAPDLDAPLFISYSRQDIKFVDRLRDDLKKRGVPYWIDQEGLSPGTPNWERSIRAAIRDSSAVLWLVSPAAYESPYVNSELAVAEMHERKIYPVWADGDNWIACVPLGKHNIQYVDMRGDSYDKGLAQLLAALGNVDSALIVPAEDVPDLPPDTEPRNPYKGLTAFTEDDVSDFFGREVLVTSLAARLDSQLQAGRARFLAVLGPSGAGKSSVVMAGLIPKLRHNTIPGSENWHYLPTITPGAHPMESLAGALATLMPSADASTVLNRLYMMGLDALNIVFDVLPAERVVLYIDQFEELFTLAKDDGERQTFISLLSGAATEPDGKLIVLLSMRADFLDYPLNYPQLGDLFDNYNALIKPMSIPELRDAIQKPARQSSLTFDDGLVADIVFALRGQDKALAGALPLLQFTLERLFAKRDGTHLTRQAYDDMGGVSGAIGTHSEAVFTALPDSAQAKLGQVFLPLVNTDEETGEPTRRRAPLETIIADPDAKVLVDAFVEARLLQTGRDDSRSEVPRPLGEGFRVRAEGAYLEVTHEALLRRWERLVDWIAEVRGDLHTLRELRKAAAMWDANNRNRDFLWLGDRGQDAQEMIARLQPDLSETEHAFARPEAEHLLDEIADIDTPHPRRSEIGTRLHQLNYTLPGAGLREDGLPDIVWCKVDVPEGATVQIEDHELPVKPFYIAKYLVTYIQFQAFVDHPNGFANPDWWDDIPDKYRRPEISDPRQPYTNYPRDSVSWYEAVAFSRWLSAELGEEVRLPMEQEWQWAAQNGLEGREYPWGQWDGRRCNTNKSGINRSTAVGMYPHGAAECGALDMSGNLREWCLNKYKSPEDTTVDTTGSSRVLRGGSFSVSVFSSRAAFRNDFDPFVRYDIFGVRLCCLCRSPSQL